MNAHAIRNTVLPVFALAAVAAVHFPEKLKPRIECSPNVQGVPAFCSLHVDYPPDRPTYQWTLAGPCDAEARTGQTIEPKAVEDHGECILDVLVSDAAGSVVASATTRINFQGATPATLASGPEPASDLPSPRLPLRYTPPAPKLRELIWPRPEFRQQADHDRVHGRVEGSNLDAYRIVFYTLMPMGWELQGEPAIINAKTGGWDMFVHYGDEYAALLVTKSYQPEPSLQSLPRVGNEVLDVRKNH